jgi:hypothetical protein
VKKVPRLIDQDGPTRLVRYRNLPSSAAREVRAADNADTTRACPSTLLNALLSCEQWASEPRTAQADEPLTTLHRLPIVEQTESAGANEPKTTLFVRDVARAPRMRTPTSWLVLASLASLSVVVLTRMSTSKPTRAPVVLTKPAQARSPVPKLAPSRASTPPPLPQAQLIADASESDAIEALSTGHYSLARDAYHSLAIEHPESRVFPLVVSVLTRRIATRCETQGTTPEVTCR